MKSYTIDDTKSDKHFSLKLGDIKQLTGQDNYNTWMFIMTRMLKAMGIYEIAVEGIKPRENDTPEVFASYNKQDNSAATAILQVVSDDILSQLSQLETSYEMWVYL